jgi:C3HC zinc finger-like/Rsm1-like
MSYALETKKRKFERILGSLTDGAASQSKATLNTRNNNPSKTSVLDETPSDASKRRRITPNRASILNSSQATSTASLVNHYLPSSRQAFLERLETYRQVTKWHIPSTDPVNASAWAKRGWICEDTDTVFCGSCKERLRVDLEVKIDQAQTTGNKTGAGPTEDDESEAYSVARDVYDGLIKRYQELILTAHSDTCPWRKRGCDASIQRIEGLLNTQNAISGAQSRYTGLLVEQARIPEVAPLPSEQATEQELNKFKFDSEEPIVKSALRLAVCGWQRKYDDVIECQNCFRSLGLWLYRGESPSMGNLDPVESHLEYCPWRSPLAQDTEITVTMQDQDGPVQRKGMVSGFILVCQAIAKDNVKKRGNSETISGEGSSEVRPATAESLTPEQREKKRLDLMRRIKELKRPFNVKSLLRKKEKA